jgi:hypothetical protein
MGGGFKPWFALFVPFFLHKFCNNVGSPNVLLMVGYERINHAYQ